MTDYTLFENWKSSHADEMQDLAHAKPNDLFIFTRFTAPLPCCFEGKQILFAKDLKETAGYIRHIFLYDILNDMTNDMDFDPQSTDEEKQKDAISIFNHWFKLGKTMESECFDEMFCDFYNKFNMEFNRRSGCEYEVRIINGADELCEFLIFLCKNHPYFDEDNLRSFCSSCSFDGESLNDFIDTFLN